MGEEFDYGALWSITEDALDAVSALTSAILQLPFHPISPWACSNPRPGAYEKWQAELKTVPERHAKAVDAIRKAAEKLTKLLVEDRFIAPVAGVWPPYAPEIARRVSNGLGMAASTARAVIAWKDDAHIGQFKRFAVSAQYALQADIAELERRADVAELAYQRQVEKLRAEHPDWSGADSTVKAVGGKPPKEPARPGNVQADRKDGSSDNGEPETRGGAEGQQMMTATNIADYINVSADTVRRWIVKGDIAAECLEDGRYGVPKDELDRLRAAQQQKRKRLGKSKEE